MARQKRIAIIERKRNGVTRYYGDFRAYSASGKKEPLIAKGDHYATTDKDVAAKLYAERLKELDARKRLKDLHGIEKQESLERYAAYHLKRKARDREATGRWLVESERHLRSAIEFFGPDTDLGAITPEHCTRWVDHLRTLKGRSGTMTDSTVRKYLNTLSNMYSRAVSERYVDRNPISDMYTKPTEEKREAAFLEAHEAALLLESARTFVPRIEDGAYRYIYVLLATFLLTGGRKSEVLGLEVDDVSLKHRKIYFRPNK